MNPGPVVHLARDGCILLGNHAARSFFELEDLAGASWLALVEVLDEATWQEVLTKGETVSVEVERNGKCVLFTHVLSPSDQTAFAFGADITKRRQAERAMARQAAELAEVARFPDMNPGPVVRLDFAGCVLRANVAALAVFGDQLIGSSWLQMTPGLSKSLWNDIKSADRIVHVETRVADRDFVFTHRRDQVASLVFVFGADVSAQKNAERALRQSEKLATLGTLAAGVAHELNNPAAATRRAADQLREALIVRESAQQDLEAAHLPDAALQRLHTLDAAGRERAKAPNALDSLVRSDREAEIEEWLDAHDVEDGWRLAPSLVAQDVTAASLDLLAKDLSPAAFSAGIQWLAAGFPVYSLVHEIGEGSSRISEIVQALKSYTYLGQAPVQSVDLRTGIDSTLVILRSKLRAGIRVSREYDETLPGVPAHGSELNQVWTNLIDNAVDAMNGEGAITIRTRRDGEWAVVEIEDDGPGIPPEIQARVFDPFFTTKEPGKGTGLGLATSYSIITEKHLGQLSVESSGRGTRFTVRLPLESVGAAPLDRPSTEAAASDL